MPLKPRVTTMSSLIQNNSLDNLLRILTNEPMAALCRCRDRVQDSEKSHNETLYESVAFTVGFVVHLKGDKGARDAFLTHDHWEGKPHAPDEGNLTRLATMFIAGATKSRGALYNRALEHTKIVDYFLEIDIEPSDIPAALKKKPIYKLLDEITGKAGGSDDHENDRTISPDKKGSSVKVSDDFDDDGDDLLGGSSGINNRPARPARHSRPMVRAGSGDGGAGRGPSRQRSRFDASRDVSVQVGAFRHIVLGMKQQQQLWICIERADDDTEDWKEFRVVNWKPLPQDAGPLH